VPRANTTTTELKDAAPAGGPAISARPGPSARTADRAGAWTKTTTAIAPAMNMISSPQNASLLTANGTCTSSLMAHAWTVLRSAILVPMKLVSAPSVTLTTKKTVKESARVPMVRSIQAMDGFAETLLPALLGSTCPTSLILAKIACRIVLNAMTLTLIAQSAKTTLT